jgi:hypothetical protein
VSRYRLGRQPNDPRKARLRLSSYLTAAPAPPPVADWLSGVASWPMLGNDTIGDCTAAGAAHAAQAVNFYGQGKTAAVSLADTIAMYSAISGYTPKDPASDVGATLQDALGYWRKTGIGGNKISAFVQIDAADLATVRMCIATFGFVYAGMNFPGSAMDQFDAGKPWSVVRSSIDGGHCVPLGAYDARSFSCVTWGRQQSMTVDFYQRYVDETWACVDLDWLRSTGSSPAGLNVAALNADFLALTGQPGPFPATAPPPTPSADQAMAAAMRSWMSAKGL